MTSKNKGSLTKNETRQLKRSFEDIKKGRVLSLKDAEKKWKI